MIIPLSFISLLTDVRGPGAGVNALSMLAHTALVPVPAPGVGSPGRVALLAGAGEAPHGVGTDGVATTVVGKVPVSALVNINTALVGRVVTVASVAVTPPAPHSVDTGSQAPTVR